MRVGLTRGSSWAQQFVKCSRSDFSRKAEAFWRVYSKPSRMMAMKRFKNTRGTITLKDIKKIIPGA